MKQIITLISFLLFYWGSIFGQSTGFDAQLIAGFNGAQVRGDDMAGFNKLGVAAGLGVSYDIAYNMNVGIELLYSSQGATPKISLGSTLVPTIQLNYLSIPVVWTINDWLFEETSGLSYYRVNAQAGLAYGRLLKKEVIGELGSVGSEALVAAFNENDISWLLGFGYQINYKIGARLRYYRSFTKLFKTTDHPQINYNDLLPFHLSFQLTYKL